MGLGMRFQSAPPATQRLNARTVRASAEASNTSNVIYELTGMAELASAAGDAAYGRAMSLTPD